MLLLVAIVIVVLAACAFGFPRLSLLPGAVWMLLLFTLGPLPLLLQLWHQLATTEGSSTQLQLIAELILPAAACLASTERLGCQVPLLSQLLLLLLLQILKGCWLSWRSSGSCVTA